MNFGIKTYTKIVNQIADGFFNENGEYLPSIGKANLISIYAACVLGDESFNDENVSATDFIDSFVSDKEKMSGLENSLKETDIFSFGSAVCDAREIVEIRKAQFARKSKMDELITAIIDKVNKFEENISPEELQSILSKLKDGKPLDEERMVDEYFAKKESVERA